MLISELMNDFFWIKTRDAAFKIHLCHYWLVYHGYWNGRFENALERAHQIYVLRSLAGDKVRVVFQFEF